MSRVWLITGSNRGLGRAFAEKAASLGDKVIAGTRKIDLGDDFYLNENVLPVKMDVTNPQEISEAVQAGAKRFGSIDILINNAGYGISGAFEEVSEKNLRQLFETDYFGVTRVIRAVLPIMRRQRSGRILSVASQAGVMGFLGSSAYCSAKFAVVGLTQALREELAPFGIQVSVICPGSFRTDFRDKSSMQFADKEIADYKDSNVHQAVLFLKEHNHRQEGDPRKAASLVAEILSRKILPKRIMIGKNCCTAVRDDLERQIEEIDSYQKKSSMTDFME